MSQAVHKDYAGAKLGMWMFLYTEVLLFGGLFIFYAVYLFFHPEAFAKASTELNLFLGALNTVVLLTSSLLVALSLTALQKGERRTSLWLLAGTIFLALVFLVIKYFEWSEKIGYGIYPNSPVLLQMPSGEIVFYGLYYITTGLHALHVLIGVVVLSVIAAGVHRGSIHSTDYIALENSALYWHLVDIVWIFVFPLYYLIH
jgi:cytochrome c oxidase subunit III